ncbi:MAG: hypothetical protein COA78_06485 [Blastopirellula sp.]|nr:MAG: hypothetical protein COA78_06485 [Blastopirellula sp.]
MDFLSNSKRVNCRFDCGQIFDRYLILVKSVSANDFTYPKSFETGSYDNTKNRPTTNQPTKAFSKT